ncbi:hypothetical protein BU16DRAFT_527551 [Lophium mytilinum]|uniref:Uncharacterized protein n=1 Tax=Lophium mytilinum TaxID=390894 RepID=A0A6A6QQP4_9PEZI|nr:hypothetical protein BU16DRAFT_527551 [Lophium mytilinum]
MLPILELPRELRDIIYEAVMDSDIADPPFQQRRDPTPQVRLTGNFTIALLHLVL